MDNNEITIAILRGILETQTGILNTVRCPEVMTTKAVAEALHTSGSNIDELRRSGELNAVKIGKGFVFLRNDVMRYINERMREQ